MSTTVAAEQIDPRKRAAGDSGVNRYGAFSPDGVEYRITNPRTPRPWTNIIANPRMGLAVSQTGSGFSWIDNSQLAVLTRWRQDSVQDSSGRFLYVRDVESGKVWSLAPAPTWVDYAHYECRHGLGYTTFITEYDGIRANWTLFVDAEETAELWLLDLRNQSGRPRRLSLCPFVEWCCGVAPDPRREFTKLFLETWYDESRRAVLARSHMWEVPSARYGHWNTDFPFVTALASLLPVEAATGDKTEFLGMYNGIHVPDALGRKEWDARFGRYHDAAAALRSSFGLEAGQRLRTGYVLAASAGEEEVGRLLDMFGEAESIGTALTAVRQSWRDRLATQRVDTPDETINHLTNDWLRYQAVSGRMWGRCGYYQQSGAFGFRDQLQDSQVWLTMEPHRCREQILLHAGHQFADGAVHHWWHPLTEQGLPTQFSDDLLWLAFVTANYLKQTGDFDLLQQPAPFLDDDCQVPLSEHVQRAFVRAFGRTSPRGLPYIGAGDWNDGLSAVGLEEKGESFWLAQFLAGLLTDWAEIHRRTGQPGLASEFEQRRAGFVKAVNDHGWDGQWYVRATLDDGRKLGTSESAVARIFLNAQVWAVLNDVAPPERARQCMAAVQEHLVSDAGPLLLTPAFDRPQPEIGYITRYAPGLRENGGVYTHAACWAIAAAGKIGDAKLVGRLLDSINPANRDPDRYWAEPYVTPGNIDGPESPYFGRGGWSWYTGSAAWLQRVIREWVLGVRPEWDGLRIEPCLPPGWAHASIKQSYRGCDYQIEIERRAGQAGVAITLDGEAIDGTLLPLPTSPGTAHQVGVIVGD